MAEDDIDALVKRGDVEGLRALASSRDTSVAKEARKGLHRLRSRGIAAASEDVRRPEAAVSVTPAAAATEERPSLATSHDGAGDQLVCLVRSDPGGVRVFQVRHNEVHGMVEFESDLFSRRQFRALRDDFLSRLGLPAAEVPGDWAHWLIDESYERTVAARRSPPRDFVRARADLRAAPRRFDEHPAKAMVAPKLEFGDGEVARLIDAPCCASWFPDEEAITRLATLLDEVETSRLVLNQEQKKDRRLEVVRRVIGEYFTKERRDRYVRRLLDAAYVVHLAGGRDQELAPLLRGIAESLADPERGIDTHPFATRLFLRCFRDEEEPKEEQGGGRVISLGESRLSHPSAGREP